MRHLLLIAAFGLWVGCGPSTPPTQLLADAEAQPDELYFASVLDAWSPGFTYEVSTYTTVSQPRDLLVELRDRTGVYGVTRQRLKPGTVVTASKVAVPAHLRDSGSVQVTALLVPVGAPRSQKLEETTQRVRIILPRPVPGPVFASGQPLAWYDFDFTRFFSNHDETTVALKPCRGEAVRQEGFCLSVRWRGFGQVETRVLQLRDGRLQVVDEDLSRALRTASSHRPPTAGGSREAYLDQLRKLRDRVAFVAQAPGGSSPAHPQLEPVVRYLDEVLAKL